MKSWLTRILFAAGLLVFGIIQFIPGDPAPGSERPDVDAGIPEQEPESP